MEEFLVHNFAPIMFVALVVFLLLGFPVSFALAANGLFFAFIGIELGLLSFGLLQALPNRIFGILSNDTLLAIPFFTFMGLILERSGMAEDLLDTIGQLFGPIRGGLAYAVIFVGALLAATTGVVAASVISMGLISLPIMLRYNYDRRLASGVIAASGTLAQIIPPSIVLIVLADQLRIAGQVSVGDMYQGAILPGLVLTGLYFGYVFGVTMVFPRRAPALPKEARPIEGTDTAVIILFLALLFGALFILGGWAVNGDAFLNHSIVLSGWTVAVPGLFAVLMWHLLAVAGAGMLLVVVTASRTRRIMLWRVVISLVPPLLLIFLVLGTIFIGLATPTEGGAMGAAGALILALLNRRLRWTLMRQAMDTTAKLSAFVIFILIGATCFSLTFNGVKGDHWVEGLLTSLPGGWLGFLIIVNLMVFVLAFFLDFFELAFIIVPLLAPTAEKLLSPVVATILGGTVGDTSTLALVWFGVLLGVNMQTSFMHPPFGFALFYLRSVAPDKPYADKVTGKEMAPVTTGQIYWGAVPFVVIQLIMVAILVIFPKLVFVGIERHQLKDERDIKIEIPRSAPDDEDTGLPKIR
jgi:TRAP-type mannitol/chloroaromatic compound transport system permease large subunit